MGGWLGEKKPCLGWGGIIQEVVATVTMMKGPKNRTDAMETGEKKWMKYLEAKLPALE